MATQSNNAPFIMLNEANSSSPLYLQIYENIREGILKGELLSSSRLPSTRMLAAQLGVSRITVTNAYEQLFAEGYLEGKTGSGTFVSSELPEEFLQTSRINPTRKKPRKKQRNLKLSEYAENLNNTSKTNSLHSLTSKYVPFQAGIPALSEFPIDVWTKLEQKLQKKSLKSYLGYGNAAGFEDLREVISSHLKSTRGVNCKPEQVVITNGTQQSLDLLGRILVDKNDKVWLENPCYLGAKHTFSSLGAKSEYLPIDDEGLNFAKARKQKEAPKLVYITPSHQFPLGVTMSLQRRLNLLEWAEKNEVWILEDDYNSEYRFSGRPISSLQGLDHSNRVIYLGTFSKTIFPALRLGCIVLPPELVEICTMGKALLDRHSSVFEQMILANFISADHFARHIRRMRKLYSERRQIMIGELESNLWGKIKIQPSSAGLHLTIWLDEKTSDHEIVQTLARKGIACEALSTYVFGQKLPPALILGYAAYNETQIKKGIKILAKTLNEI